MDAIDFANYIVEKQIKERDYTNTISLQKVLYFVNCRFMLDKNEPVAIFNDPIQKWKYGPVVPEVYHAYKLFGPIEITSIPASHAFFWDKKDFLEELQNKLDVKQKILDSWIDEFISMPPFELVDLTHEHELWRQDESKIMEGYMDINYDINDLFIEIKSNPMRFFGKV